MTPRIHVIGSVNIDFIVRTKTLPRAGETLGDGVFSTSPGGKGANQALAARRLGADVSLEACVGQDAYASIALENLKNDGVDLSLVQHQAEAATGAAFINVDDEGENQIAVAPGANALLSAEGKGVRSADVVMAQLETPAAETWKVVGDNDVFFCFNPAPAINVDPQLFWRADLLVINETERAFYRDLLKSRTGLIAETYGADGAALIRNGRRVAEATPPKVDVVDTTGAGDCFTAALATAIADGRDDQDALRFACAASALSVTKLGAQNALPYKDDVLDLLAR